MPKRGTFCRFQAFKRVGISEVEEYEVLGKSVI